MIRTSDRRIVHGYYVIFCHRMSVSVFLNEQYAGIGNQLIGIGTMLCVLNNSGIGIISKPIGYTTDRHLHALPYIRRRNNVETLKISANIIFSTSLCENCKVCHAWNSNPKKCIIGSNVNVTFRNSFNIRGRYKCNRIPLDYIEDVTEAIKNFSKP